MGEIDDDITRLREGDTSDFFDEDDEEEAKQEEAFSTDDDSSGATTAPAATMEAPAVIRRVLGSEYKDELLAIAHFLDPNNTKRHTLTFHTPIGDVKSQIRWAEKLPKDLSRYDRLMLIQVKSSEAMFAPTPGADLEISIEGSKGRLKVTNLAPPQNLYPGIDLFCFLPHNEPMEKQGVLKESAPSVVSGKPSDTTDAAGEPIAEGEKSASLKGKTFVDVHIDETEDFDKPRES